MRFSNEDESGENGQIKNVLFIKPKKTIQSTGIDICYNVLSYN